MGRPCQMAKKGATQCHEGLEEIDVLLHLSQCMRCVQRDTQMKRNPNRTHHQLLSQIKNPSRIHLSYQLEAPNQTAKKGTQCHQETGTRGS